MEYVMGREFYPGLMVICMMDVGKMVKKMVLVNMQVPMEINILGNIKMVRNMVKDIYNYILGMIIMDIGKKIK